MMGVVRPMLQRFQVVVPVIGSFSQSESPEPVCSQVKSTFQSLLPPLCWGIFTVVCERVLLRFHFVVSIQEENWATHRAVLWTKSIKCSLQTGPV